MLGLTERICASTNQLNLVALAHHLDDIQRSIGSTGSPDDVSAKVVGKVERGHYFYEIFILVTYLSRFIFFLTQLNY